MAHAVEPAIALIASEGVHRKAPGLYATVTGELVPLVCATEPQKLQFVPDELEETIVQHLQTHVLAVNAGDLNNLIRVWRSVAEVR